MVFMKTNIELLKERIEQNYTDFRFETLIKSEEEIYDMAARISAVEDAYYQMTEYGYADEDDAGYLLHFHDPLEMIADFLEQVRVDEPDEFDNALIELFEREDNEDNYITTELADELKLIHGDNVNIKLALLTEAIKVGNQFLRLRKLINGDGEGVDFCFKEE
jgi:hypothetical protein